MRARSIVAMVFPALLIAACSLPTDELATPINPNDLGDLANTTTTSTTTPPTTTTTSTPPVTGDSVAPPQTTTTALPSAINTAPVDLFYTIGFNDQLARLTRDLNVDASLQQVIEQLETPVTLVAELSLRTAVRRGMVDEVRVDRGTATVVLNRSQIESIPDTTLQRAISQLVLTLTSFRTPDVGNIGQVRFEVDDEGFAVFVPSFGGQSEAGEALAFTDFAGLIADTSAPTTTTTIEPPPPSSDPITTAG